MMFNTLLNDLSTAISAPFLFLENLFSPFGLSFYAVFAAMIVSAFVVRNFIRVFFTPHI